MAGRRGWAPLSTAGRYLYGVDAAIFSRMLTTVRSAAGGFRANPEARAPKSGSIVSELAASGTTV
jgi:hypothetical protein